jgi:hypothetical protein
MNLNALPVVGWVLSFIGNASLAVPFWICWTICGIGKLYFDFIPEQWQSIPFWNCVGLFLSVSIIKTVFVPKIVSLSQSAGGKYNS